MAIGDISVVRVVGRFMEQNIVNTLHYYHESQDSDETEVLDALTLAWYNTLVPAWNARHSIDYTLIGLKAFRVTGDSKVPSFKGVASPGDVTGAAELSFAARVITLYTAAENHRRRGRLQLSGGAAAMFDPTDGSVLDAEVVLLDVLGDTLRDPLVISGDGFSLCLRPTLTQQFEFITASRARKTPAVIRSRRIKGFFIG